LCLVSNTVTISGRSAVHHVADYLKLAFLLNTRGKWQQSSGETRCMVCFRGRYGPTPGLSICTSCEKGKYQSSNGRSTGCNPCAQGRFNADTGSSTGAACDACPGSVAMSCNCFTLLTPSLVRVVVLNLRHYITSACVCCWRHSGKYALFTGKSFCNSCSSGKWSPFTARSSSSCAGCDQGRFNSGFGRSVECGTCPKSVHE
jgi:hypothetical protein